RCGAADTAREGDDEAAVAALVGTDLQESRFGDAVEAGPVEAVVGVVQFAGQSGHERDLVGLALGEAFDGLGEGSVVGLHGDSSGARPGASCPRTPWATN